MYEAASVKRLSEFLTRCRQQLTNEENLFWVSLQSNVLADLCHTTSRREFDKALQAMKEEMKRNGWILPTLKANMRNEVNIANVQVERGSYGDERMNSLIEKLKSGTSLIGEVPILFYVNEWNKKKNKVLKHCIELMSQKNDKNIVVLWIEDYFFKDVADDIKRVIKDKKVVPHPSKQSKKEGISNVKQFLEKCNHILATKTQYFNDCESANVIFLNETGSGAGLRNSILRGVENIICIEVSDDDFPEEIEGMKEDNRFWYIYETTESDLRLYHSESESESDFERKKCKCM